MRSFTHLMLARAMEEELRRQARPRPRQEPAPTTKVRKSRTRSWSTILSFPRLQPSKG